MRLLKKLLFRKSYSVLDFFVYMNCDLLNQAWLH
jgi:hypothetical protein